MNKKTRLLIFFLGIGIMGVIFLWLSFSMSNTNSFADDQCSQFGSELTWQAIELEKFNNFWVTKNGIDKKYCETNNGTWGSWSKKWQSCYCAMSAPDARKVCRNSSDCLSGTCLYDAKKVKDETQNTIGGCAEFKMQYPTPNCEFDRVENGSLVKKNCLK